jgi:TPP-dependent pyruvate/acetoin dehydrogenase alpha subunit
VGETEMNIWQLYELMLKSRRYEDAVKNIWNEGKIPGEMHMGIGEEAIIAAVVSQLKDGDAIAVDHRGTAAFLMRGVDPVALLLEFMGHPKGLCRGYGGHMHLFSKEFLMSSSGIVGSEGPSACGYALSARYKKKDNLAVAFFGEGSMNQGMMLESYNLASAWNLPVLFVCKDSEWAITTRSSEVRGGNLVDRAHGFGLDAIEVDGTDPAAMWNAVNVAIIKIRTAGGPYFIHAKCEHKEGHFLGDPLLRFIKTPIEAFGKITGPLIKSMFSFRGTIFTKRIGSLNKIIALILKSRKQLSEKSDPTILTKTLLETDESRLKSIETKVNDEINKIVSDVIKIAEDVV